MPEKAHKWHDLLQSPNGCRYRPRTARRGTTARMRTKMEIEFAKLDGVQSEIRDFGIFFQNLNDSRLAGKSEG